MPLRKTSTSGRDRTRRVLPKPKVRRRWTPAPSSVGLTLIRQEAEQMNMRRIAGRVSALKAVRKRQGASKGTYLTCVELIAHTPSLMPCSKGATISHEEAL